MHIAFFLWPLSTSAKPTRINHFKATWSSDGFQQSITQGVIMENRIYLINMCLLWWCKVSYNKLTVSTVQNHWVNIMANISLQLLIVLFCFFLDEYHTKTYALTFNQRRGSSTGVTLQRRNNTEGTEKLLSWDKYTTFFYNGLYVHNKLVKQKQSFFSVFLEKVFTSETWSALDSSQKLMSA